MSILEYFKGQLTFKKKLEIDEFVEKLKYSEEIPMFQAVVNNYLYDILLTSSGECAAYLNDNILSNVKLKNRFAVLLYEVGYQKMKDKKYKSLPKGKTSRGVKEITKTKKNVDIPDFLGISFLVR